MKKNEKKKCQRCFKRWWLACRSSHFLTCLSEPSCSKHFKDARMPAVLWRCEHVSDTVTRKRSNGSKYRRSLVAVTLLLACSQRQRTAGMRTSLKCFEHDGSLRYLGKCELWHANHNLLKHRWHFFLISFSPKDIPVLIFCQQEKVAFPGPPWGGYHF